MQNPTDKSSPIAMPGVTVVSQRETPAANIYEFTLAPHNERTTLKALLTRLGPHSELAFHDPAAADPADPDSPGQLHITRVSAHYQTRRGAGACITDWAATDVNDLLNQLVALAPSNRGRMPRDRARLTVRKAKA